MKLLSLLSGTVRATRTVHAVMMTLVGCVLRPELVHLSALDLLLPLFSVAFLWQFTTMLNDIYDMDIDRIAHPERPLVSGEISLRRYRRWTYYMLIIGLFLSFICGFVPTILAILYIFLSIIYSEPPLRIRNRWYGTSIIGIGSGVYFSMGYWTHFWLFDLDYFYLIYPTYIAFSVLIIIVFALSLAPNITAYKDYEGDSKAGVITIYTILGRKKGKKVVALTSVLLFLIPSALFFSWINLLISLASGLAAYISFMKYECYKCIFIIYFSILIYYLIFILFFI